MTRRDIRWLLACASLAAGEGLAARNPEFAGAWPAVALAAALVALAGYGFRLRHWAFAFLVLAGVSAYLFASVERERELRSTPWLRGIERRAAHRPQTPSPLKRDLMRRVAIGLDPSSETVAVNRAMLLGEKGALRRSTRKRFVESGTVHVFAISGLHVMIVAKLLMLAAAAAFVPYRLQGVVAIPLVWGYVSLVGASPSAVRAAAMATFHFAAPLFWRRPDSVASWSLAFLAVHIANPVQIADIASQLSFTVMLALIAARRAGCGRMPAALQTVYLTAVAWAAGTPIAAAAFGRVTPGGMLANLFLVGAAGHSVAAGAVGLAASFACEPLAAHLNNLAALVSESMIAVADAVARIPGANMDAGEWGAGACIAWYAALALLLYAVHRFCARRERI